MHPEKWKFAKKKERYFTVKGNYITISHITAFFFYFSCDARDYFRHERYVSIVYYNNYKLNANIMPNHTSHLIIEIKNNVSCPPIFRLWASIFTKSATGMCVYIACMYSAGCAGTFHQHACMYTGARARVVAPRLCVHARMRGCVQRARDAQDDYSDIVVIVEGTIARQ